jgi:hypothetical protein
MNTRLQRRWNLSIAKNANQGIAAQNDRAAILADAYHEAGERLIKDAQEEGLKPPYQMFIGPVKAATEVNGPSAPATFEEWGWRGLADDGPHAVMLYLSAENGQLVYMIDPREVLGLEGA